MKRRILVTLMVVWSLLHVSVAGAAVRYVKSDGVGTGSCTTWATACTLPYAISVAASGDSVWVKQGTYGPIALVNGVKIIGGFDGTETQASQSNPITKVTVIDGGGVEQCVVSQGTGSATVLRGFTIKNGYIGNTFDQEGAGASLLDSDARFVQCIFENNVADWFGAAVAIRGSGQPQFINCTFRNNGSGTAGGAQDDNVKPIAGGAVFLHSGTATFVNSLFHGNKAAEGAVIANVRGTPTLVNCTIVNNYAKYGYGGGVFDEWAKGTLRNCIVWGNTSIKGGDQVYNAPNVSTPVTYSNVQGGWTGSGNINSDPVFVNPSGGDFKLQCSSPCRDAGISANPSLPDDVGDLDWDTITSEPTPKDLALSARIYSAVEMGAYELLTCIE